MGILAKNWEFPSERGGNLTKPAGNLTKPAGNLTKPAGNLTKPAGNSTKPTGNLTSSSSNYIILRHHKTRTAAHCRWHRKKTPGGSGTQGSQRGHRASTDILHSETASPGGNSARPAGNSARPAGNLTKTAGNLTKPAGNSTKPGCLVDQARP